MNMTMTGIYLVTATTGTGRVVDYAGTEDDIDVWLGELSSVEALFDVERHEMTEAELDAYGPVYDGPCSDGEPGA